VDLNLSGPLPEQGRGNFIYKKDIDEG